MDSLKLLLPDPIVSSQVVTTKLSRRKFKVEVDLKFVACAARGSVCVPQKGVPYKKSEDAR
jgi:hypothetical protein